MAMINLFYPKSAQISAQEVQINMRHQLELACCALAPLTADILRELEPKLSNFYLCPETPLRSLYCCGVVSKCLGYLLTLRGFEVERYHARLTAHYYPSVDHSILTVGRDPPIIVDGAYHQFLRVLPRHSAMLPSDDILIGTSSELRTRAAQLAALVSDGAYIKVTCVYHGYAHSREIQMSRAALEDYFYYLWDYQGEHYRRQSNHDGKWGAGLRSELLIFMEQREQMPEGESLWVLRALEQRGLLTGVCRFTEQA